MESGDVKVSSGVLWNWPRFRLVAQHPTRPSQGFAEIASHSCWQSQIVCYQSRIMVVALFLGPVKRGPEFPFRRRQVSGRQQAKSPGISTLHSHTRTFACEGDG